MTELWNWIAPFVTPEKMLGLLRATILLAVGFVVGKLLSRTVFRIGSARLQAQQAVLLRRMVFYLILLLFLIAAFHELGFDLGVLLGAAGVVSVAIGFASQTSASNLISGLFLIAERPFANGDVISVGGTTGEVLSIDLLSLKLRTFDNVFVRIPNETLIKTEVRTLTKFPIRRADIPIGVAYKEDLARVHQVLLELGDQHPLCLDEPKPQFFVIGFADSSVQIQFSPWTTRENYAAFKTAIQVEIRKRFEEAGIEIAFPHRALVPMSGTAPFPVRVVETDDVKSGEEPS